MDPDTAATNGLSAETCRAKIDPTFSAKQVAADTPARLTGWHWRSTNTAAIAALSVVL